MKRLFSRLIPLALALVATWYLTRQSTGETAPEEAPPAIAVGQPGYGAAARAESAQDAVRKAFEDRAQGRQIRVGGVVRRLLSDDREGSPHQRFIIGTPSGLTVLVAHNLDLAPRLEGLAAGEQVIVYGEYEWNEQGGVMHWTHDDPAGLHETGYVEWRGRRYQ